ncbi:MAG: IS1380 family transposase [Bdellovibrionota bacterium]
MTDCKIDSIEFQAHNHKQVVAQFNGGNITSDAGSILLRQTDQRIGLLKRFAACFSDDRNPELIEHTVLDLVSQRTYGICCGYEDLNDHDDLRHDRLLALLVGKADVEGNDRRRESDQGIALAGKSTLNRLELIPQVSGEYHRYHRISYDPLKVDALMANLFLESFETPPEKIVLDLDTTDDPLHGNQEGRFFNGYYDCYCYTPLYVFCGEHLLLSRIQTANVDGAANAVVEIKQIIEKIRQKWPEVKIVVRGDSGFCREELMTWCEANDVFFLLGMGKNERLLKKAKRQISKSKRRYYGNKQPTRRFATFMYRTQKSWSCSRQVVCKAEHLEKGANPRFVVTNLKGDDFVTPQFLYEKIYCARGDMENRIKEQQMDMFADRTSTAVMRSNQLRMYFSAMAYILMQSLRRIGLQGTDFAKAQCGTLRVKLMKIGAQIKITARRILLSLASACPYAKIFYQAWLNLNASLKTAVAVT